jgi:hypothetical protein
MIRRNIGPIDTIGMTSAGSLYYRVPVGSPIDSITIARREGDSWVVNNEQNITSVAPSWSPDSKTLAFNRHKPGGPRGQFNVMIKNMDTGEERMVAQDQYYGGPAPTWLSDGTLLVNINTGRAASGTDSSTKSLALLDVTGQSAAKQLFTFDQNVLGLNGNALARDGKSLYFVGRAPKEGRFVNQATYCILKVDIDTQRIEEIAPLPRDSVALAGGTRVRLSPDGETIAQETRRASMSGR